MIMESEKKKKPVLFEDLTASSGFVGGMGKGPGQTGMVHKPGKVTLLDLLKQAGDWEQEMQKAPNRLPFPLQDGVGDQLGELYIMTQEIKSKVAQSAKSHIIKDSETAMKAVNKIHKKLSVMCGAIQEIVKDLDSLGVGTSAKEDHA